MAQLSTKQKQHKALCSVCNHPDCKEIEAEYLRGGSPYQIELDYPGVGHKSVYAHARMFGLDKKRDNTVLTQLRRIIDRGGVKQRKISDPLLGKAYELTSKITGELVERSEHKHKGELDLKVISEQLQQQLAKGKEKLKPRVRRDSPD